MKFTTCIFCCFSSVLLASEQLLPMAEMAAEDGRPFIAERWARDLLTKLGLDKEESIRATEVLLRSALEEGRYETVLSLLKETTEIGPLHSLVFAMVAHNQLGQYGDSQALYKEAKSIDTNDEWGLAAARLLLEAKLKSNQPVTDKDFSVIADSKAATPEIQASNALLQGQYLPKDSSTLPSLLEAIKVAFPAAEAGPCITMLESLCVSDGAKAKGYKLVSQLLTQAKDLKPAPSQDMLARVALTASKLAPSPAEALPYLRQAAKIAQDEPLHRRALFLLGNRLIAAPETFEEGIRSLEDAVRLNPSSPDAPNIQLSIAEQLFAHNLIDRALLAYRYYMEGYDKPEFFSRSRLGYAHVLMAAKRPEEALQILESTLDESSQRSSDELLLLSAEAAESAGLYKKAVQCYLAAIERMPTSELYLHLARNYEAAGQRDEAKRTYAIVRDKFAENEALACTATLRLGAILSEDQRGHEDIAEYTLFLPNLKDVQNQCKVYFARGCAYYLLGNLNQAKEDFEHVIKNSKEVDLTSESIFYLILSYYGLGDDDKAIQLCESYEKTYPTAKRLPDILLWQAKRAFNHGNYTVASELFENFADRYPMDADRVQRALYYAARAAYQSQDYSRTIELVARLATRFPNATNLANARFLQCEALMELARYAEATEILNTLIRHNPNAEWVAEAYGRMAECLFLTATDNPQRYTLAKEAYDEALARDKSDDRILMYHYKLGRLYEKMDQKDPAIEQYLKLVYRVLENPSRYTEVGLQWLQKSLSRIKMLELSSGNQAQYELLMRRVRRAALPSSVLPQ